MDFIHLYGSKQGNAKYHLLSVLSFSIYPEEEINRLLEEFYSNWRKRNLPSAKESLKRLQWSISYADSILYHPQREFMELAIDEARNPQIYIALQQKRKLLERIKKKIEILLKRFGLTPKFRQQLQWVFQKAGELLQRINQLIEAMRIGQQVKLVVEEIQRKYPEIVDFWLGEFVNGKVAVYLETNLGVKGAMLHFDEVTHEGVEIIENLEKEINQKFARPFISRYYLA
ncbi:MAG: hypothetical protein ABGW77_07140 [Campylobacterales bacterium]